MSRKKKVKGMDYHYLTPKCRIKRLTRSQRNDVQNLLHIKITKHTAWHQIFGVLTLDEVISLLQRIKRAKSRGFR